MHIVSYIDHTILKPATTDSDIEKLCKEAIQYNFAAVCVPPYYVGGAKRILSDTPVKIATVIGFPFGYDTTASKLEAIKQAISNGADELDIVHNTGALKNDDWEYLSNEITACLQPARLHNKLVKVIIESGILPDEAIISCCRLYAEHKVDFIKTSTGYAEKGADVAQVRLIRKHLPERIAIKASGGIRTYEFAKQLIDAGASRIGTSSGVAIAEEANKI